MAICGNRNWLLGLLGVFNIIGVLVHVIFCCENHALAQITPDGTLGNNSSKITPNVNIKGSAADRIDGGATLGANLFHSFREFNVGESQQVYFANPTGIKNILTRVTGSNISNILGTLGVDGGANLFVLNPNGILFRKNARLDVAGSFVASTANSFVFGNGLEFSATNPQTPSPLLTVNPSALLFNQLQAGRIENRSIAPAGIDPAGFNAFGLRVGDGKSLLLVGGNVSMDGGKLNAYGGRVELGGLAASGNVNIFFNGDNLSLKFPENVTRASVSLNNQAGVFVTGAGSGNIAINARNLEILGGSLLSAGIGVGLGTPESVAGDIILKATGEIKIAGSGSTINNLVRLGSKGNGGNITIDSGSFSLQDGAQLSASTFGQGNAGNATVTAKDAVSLAGAVIFSNVGAEGVGKGSNININAATLSLTDGAQLQTITEASDTQPARRGDAGNVNVKVTGAVDIAGEKNGFFSGIGSFLGKGTVGNGGNITIDSGSFSLRDGARLSASTFGQGNGGNITIDSGSFSLRDGAQLSASTFGQGNGGNIIVRASDFVSLAGKVNIFSTVAAEGVGKGGNIDINARFLSLTDGAQLNTSTFGNGNGGNVTVRAKDAVSLTGFETAIFTTVNSGGVGKAGNIDINAASLSLTDSAQLLTYTSGVGDAGDINLQGIDAVDIAGEKNDFPSGIYSVVNTGAIGNGGNITIDSRFFSLRDGSRISASTLGQGNGGNVTVNAKDAVSLANGSILSAVEAGGVGKGGDIDINAASLSLTDGAQLQASTTESSATQPAGQGDAGNVNIKVNGAVDIAGEKNGFLSAIRSVVSTGTIGKGGNITIDSGSLSLRDRGQLNTSTSGQGNAGNVIVRAKDAIFLAGNAAILSTVEAGGVGKGGNIDIINAASLSLTDGAQLLTYIREASATQPAGQGDAGNVNIKVTSGVNIAGRKNGFPSGIISAVDRGAIGNGGNITINPSFFSLQDGAEINASTRGQGNAGNIRINAKDVVTVSGTSQESGFSSALFTFTDSDSIGKGGDITVKTNIFRISNGALLDARTRNDSKGGDIMLNANIFEAFNGGQLTTTTSSNGSAGKITVQASERVIVDGIDTSFNNRIAQFPDIVSNLGAASGLFVRSESTGSAGDIEIVSPFIRLDNQGKLIAESASGDGGNITLQVRDILLLRRGSLISATAGTTQQGGNGGNITINAPNGFIVAGANENTDISANAFTGSGGKVEINARSIFNIQPRSREDLVRRLGTENLNPQRLQTNDITAISQQNPTLNGQVTINTPDTDPSRGLIQLPSNLVDASQQIAQGCTPTRGQNASSFIATGRGGLPQSPNEPLRGRAVITGWVDLPPQATAITDKLSTATMTKSTDRIVEAQGWIVDAKGDVILVAQYPQSSSIPSAMSCSQ
ncbi:MAG: filamentous hemagglutinin N-terminal domain-containing protein [Nostoc indistinguendum CM1-VF10]|jgi:filamentous hemagglutinin family protein|nr:filamentous hemagglutinin N-terminal domain-containing protein [Nostoc indistinguendum CM1-VF10]